jgi:hypothetical protein
MLKSTAVLVASGLGARRSTALPRRVVGVFSTRNEGGYPGLASAGFDRVEGCYVGRRSETTGATSHPPFKMFLWCRLDDRARQITPALQIGKWPDEICPRPLRRRTQMASGRGRRNSAVLHCARRSAVHHFARRSAVHHFARRFAARHFARRSGPERMSRLVVPKLWRRG